MEINRQNYEAYLLDLLEGRLDEETTSRLKEFLLSHPECGPDLDEEIMWRLEPEAFRFSGRDRLKKEFPVPESILTVDNFDMFSVARMEGDLTREQETAHIIMVASESRWQKEWDQWQRTQLEKEIIPFRWKKDLKKRIVRPNPVLWTGVAAAAAAVALVLILIRTGAPGPTPVPGPGEISRQESSRIMEDQQGNNAADEETTFTDINGSQKPDAERLAQTGNPVSLSIRKHQDPPELTGLDWKGSLLPSADSSDAVKADRTEPNPVDITLSAVRIAAIAETGTYDRILALDLPPVKGHEAALTMTTISEKGLRQASQDFLREKDITLLGIASAGIQGFSRLTGADLTFGITRDENGKITVIRFRSDLLSVDAPLRKSE
jgi:hypothetical protein